MLNIGRDVPPPTLSATGLLPPCEIDTRIRLFRPSGQEYGDARPVPRATQRRPFLSHGPPLPGPASRTSGQKSLGRPQGWAASLSSPPVGLADTLSVRDLFPFHSQKTDVGVSVLGGGVSVNKVKLPETGEGLQGIKIAEVETRRRRETGPHATRTGETLGFRFCRVVPGHRGNTGHLTPFRRETFCRPRRPVAPPRLFCRAAKRPQRLRVPPLAERPFRTGTATLEERTRACPIRVGGRP